MATKLNGMLVLSKIPKGMVGTTKKGEKCLFVDIVPRRNGADEYGNTHSIQVYNKETKETIYLGNLKPVEFGKDEGNTPNPSVPIARGNEVPDDGDLPW